MSGQAIVREAFEAYLHPLLKKHENGKIIKHEDLLASWEAADAILKQHKASTVAVKRVSNMHQSQLRAYTETAKQALHDWANQWTLPEIGESEDDEQYLTKTIELAKNERPWWHVADEIIEKEVVEVIKARANQVLEAAHKEAMEQEEEEEADELEEGEEEEHDDEDKEEEEEEEEEGEEGSEPEKDDDEEDEEKTEPVQTKTQPKNRGILAKKRALKTGAKQAVRKKGTNVKSTGGQQPNKGARRKNTGRPRRGRGSGNK